MRPKIEICPFCQATLPAKTVRDEVNATDFRNEPYVVFVTTVAGPLLHLPQRVLAVNEEGSVVQEYGKTLNAAIGLERREARKAPEGFFVVVPWMEGADRLTRRNNPDGTITLRVKKREGNVLCTVRFLHTSAGE